MAVDLLEVELHQSHHVPWSFAERQIYGECSFQEVFMMSS